MSNTPTGLVNSKELAEINRRLDALEAYVRSHADPIGNGGVPPLANIHYGKTYGDVPACGHFGAPWHGTNKVSDVTCPACLKKIGIAPPKSGSSCTIDELATAFPITKSPVMTYLDGGSHDRVDPLNWHPGDGFIAKTVGASSPKSLGREVAESLLSVKFANLASTDAAIIFNGTPGAHFRIDPPNGYEDALEFAKTTAFPVTAVNEQVKEWEDEVRAGVEESAKGPIPSKSRWPEPTFTMVRERAEVQKKLSTLATEMDAVCGSVANIIGVKPTPENLAGAIKTIGEIYDKRWNDLESARSACGCQPGEDLAHAISATIAGHKVDVSRANDAIRQLDDAWRELGGKDQPGELWEVIRRRMLELSCLIDGFGVRGDAVKMLIALRREMHDAHAKDGQSLPGAIADLVAGWMNISEDLKRKIVDAKIAVGDPNSLDLTGSIARAIARAKSDEREACAKIALDMAEEFPATWHRDAARLVAARLRRYPMPMREAVLQSP